MTAQKVAEDHAWARLVRKMKVLAALPPDDMHAHNWRQLVEEAKEDWARAYREAGSAV